MPRAGQIIPRYIHPHDMVVINDNTVYQDYTADNDGIVRYLCIFPSSKGRDKLMKFNNFSKWVDEFGLPNYRTYGQAPYLPYVLLSTGLTEVYCIRITASNSTYANLILVAGYKEDNGKLRIKFKVYSQEGLRNADDLDTVANSLETLVPDEDGYRYVPIATFWSIGRGLYGNDFRIRITHDKAADKDNDYKNYELAVLSTEDGASLVESFGCAFYVDALDPLTNKTIYVEDVVNDEDGNGSNKINMQFFSDNYQKLFNEYEKIYYANAEDVVPTDVSELPALELPSAEALYNLTAADGTYAAGIYVYNSSAGMWAASTYSIMEVTALPTGAGILPTNLYHLSAPYTSGSDTYEAGYYASSNGGSSWTKIDVYNVTKLPSITLYTPGVVYRLTAADGDKPVGSMWIYDATANDYVAYTAPEAEDKEPLDLTIENWDMFGYNRLTGELDENMVVEGGTDSLTFMSLEGNALMNGSDGDLGEEQPVNVRQRAIEEGFTRALDGQVDRLVLSTRHTPFEQMYDANLSVNIKKALAAFALKRKDFALHLDCGLLQTTSDLRSMATSLGSIDSYLISIDSGMMMTMDPITGRNIPVSILLWMAQKYPSHVANFGWHTPFAGERYAIVSGYSSNKQIKPAYDEELDADILEELYERYHMNYLQCLDEHTFVRGTQITTQSVKSDLCKENNVMVTLEIKRKIERMIAKNRYNWTDNESIRIFKHDCQMLFSSYAGYKCQSLDIDVKQSAWERTRYILHAYLAVVFRKYQERGIVEIDLNPS